MKKVFGVSTQIVGQNLRTKSRGSQISLQIKNLPMDAGDSRDEGLIPGSRRSPGEGNGTPLQYSCLENFHGLRSPVGCSPWGHKESDTTERIHFHFKCPAPVSALFSSAELML